MSLILNSKNSKDIHIANGLVNGKKTKIYWTEDYDEKITYLDVDECKPTTVLNKNQIFSSYVCGAAGSGKSYYTETLLKNLLKTAKEKNRVIKDIFLVSAQSDVEELFRKYMKPKGYKPKKDEDPKPFLYQVNIENPKLYEAPIENFKDSIWIFDDFESVSNKLLKKAIFKFLEALLMRGRKLNIHVLIIKHAVCNYSETKTIIAETQNIVLFPKYNIRDTKMFLKNYMSFTEKELKEVEHLETRGLFIRKIVPQYMLWDKGIKLI